MLNDNYYMAEALKLAELAFEQGEVPVGAVVVCRGQIIAKGYNQTQKLQDVTAHAEMIALTAASQKLGAKYLKDCSLYVTLEPCVMCGGAIFWSQVNRIVIGASDEKRGFSTISERIIHPKTQVTWRVMENESKELLHKFFKKLRT